MIRLKVLRYMGVLTIMKFGLFAVSALSLLLALGWILVYCPQGSRLKPSARDSNGNNRQDGDMAMYFRHFESKLDEELEELQKKEPKKLTEKGRPSSNVEYTIPMERFSDEAFQSTVDQLHEKRLDGYEFLIESTNVTIYRKMKKNGLYEYKLYANMPSASPDMLTTVFLDADYRREWDSYVTELNFVKKSESGPDVIYFNVDFPWPLSNRDYVYARETREIERKGTKYYTIIMHSVSNHNIPLKRGVVRVDDFHQMLAMESDGTGGTMAFIHYYDDPKGSIPSWLINWAAKTGVPGFLGDIQRACKGYEPFKKKHGRM